MQKIKLVLFFCLVSTFGFCQFSVDNLSVDLNKIPELLNKSFDAHGTFFRWRIMNQLSFKLTKENGEFEHHLIDLKSRKIRIESESYTIGFDGDVVWMNSESNFPQEKLRFYHSLYFYFYSMPFVFGDSGINYKRIKDLNINGDLYSGLKITYNSNIGDSPNDNYFIYFDKKTHQMKWLGYTVTFGSAKPNSNINFIKYSEWQNINGLVLPKKIEWYSVKNKIPYKLKASVSFDEVYISEDKISTKKFEKLKGAIVE